jgi:hypothetical protein
MPTPPDDDCAELHTSERKYMAGSHFLPRNRARSRGLQPAFGFQTDTLPRQPVLYASQHLGPGSRAIMNHSDADKLRQSS